MIYILGAQVSILLQASMPMTQVGFNHTPDFSTSLQKRSQVTWHVPLMHVPSLQPIPAGQASPVLTGVPSSQPSARRCSHAGAHMLTSVTIGGDGMGGALEQSVQLMSTNAIAVNVYFIIKISTALLTLLRRRA